MSNLNRLRELAGLKRFCEAESALKTVDAAVPAEEANPEDVNADETVSPDESSKVQSASDDIAKAKVHIKNIQKLSETIRTDVGKYVAKIEKYVLEEFGSMSGLTDIDKESAAKIMGYFTKLHAIANGK